MTMNSSLKYVLATGLVALPLLACGQQSPPGADDTGTDTTADATADTTGDTTPIDEDGSYYPLVDGATWTYVASTTSGQILGTEIVNATEITWEGAPAWLFVDNPNASGEWTESTITELGTAAVRVHKEIKDSNGTLEIVDYDPGFVRADDKWDTAGFIEEILYERVATDGAGLNPKIEARGHTYEILALNEVVTVEAGTFNCIKVQRTRTVGTSAGDNATFWHARGIGKVREERPIEGRIEELASVSIPGGASYP